MKKVLIVAYYWPPAGGPGVQRWLKFVKYLRHYNIEPVLYVPENPTYPIIDTSFENEIPDGITILKQPIFEPYRFASFFSKKETKTISSGMIATEKKQSLIQRVLLFIRGNFFIPDARVFWVKPSINYLQKYLVDQNIDTIVTTGPPHSMHLIGLGLKKKLNLTWITDFRDPWTTIGYHDKLKLGKRASLKHQKLEKEVLENTDQIIVTSFTTQKEFKELTTQPITVITNGYDTENIQNIELDSDFTISHIGSLLSGRNPLLLWKVFADLIKENKAFSKVFKLQLVGAVSDDVLSTIHQSGIHEHLELIGYVPHSKAIELQKKSQLLLLIEINREETKCIIPGKLFEYMASSRPILAIGPEGADIFKIIKDTNTGTCHRHTDYDSLKKVILVHFENYQKKQLHVNSNNIEQYSRKELTKKLSSLLLKI